LLPSARANRDALSGGGQPPDDPAAAFSAGLRPARPRPFASRRRPCGFSLYEHDAVLPDVRALGRLHNAPLRRVAAAAKRVLARSIFTIDRPCGVNRGNRLVYAHERSVTSSAAASFPSPPWAVMHRRVLCAVFRYRQLEPARPGRTSGPSLFLRPAALMGFFWSFAGLLPRRVAHPSLDQPGPLARFHFPPSARFIFAGLNSAAGV